MATGMAKGLAARGKRAAFGDGRRIIWSPHAHDVFRGNPNVAPPGHESAKDLTWIAHYRNHRLYGSGVSGRWEWYANFHAIPGEIYLTADEQEWAKQVGSNFILLEPNVKQTAPNKQWPFERYQALVDGLRTDHPDMRIVQPFYGGQRLAGVELVSTPNFRSALAMLARADLLVGAEGGLHHGAAAFGKPAVVIFGGYIHPRTTGYATHVNIYDPADGTPCGIAGRRCAHCKRVMASIPVEMVRRGIESFIAKRRDDVPSQRLLATGR